MLVDDEIYCVALCCAVVVVFVAVRITRSRHLPTAPPIATANSVVTLQLHTVLEGQRYQPPPHTRCNNRFPELRELITPHTAVDWTDKKTSVGVQEEERSICRIGILEPSRTFR